MKTLIVVLTVTIITGCVGTKDYKDYSDASKTFAVELELDSEEFVALQKEQKKLKIELSSLHNVTEKEKNEVRINEIQKKFDMDQKTIEMATAIMLNFCNDRLFRFEKKAEKQAEETF